MNIIFAVFLRLLLLLGLCQRCLLFMTSTYPALFLFRLVPNVIAKVEQAFLETEKRAHVCYLFL
jgi:hypothetical protein